MYDKKNRKRETEMEGDPRMSNVKDLELKIKDLEKENTYLKSLLMKEGIPFEHNSVMNESNEVDQGKRIIPKTNIMPEDANNFFSMFWGRTDVYSQRTIVKSTGAKNYYPQCYKIWKTGCPKLIEKSKRCSECSSPAFIPLGKEQIIRHLKGGLEDGSDVIGVYPLLPDDTCRFIVFDFDNHEKGADKNDFANVDDSWKDEVDSLRDICKINGIDALVERSSSGRGAHLWIFFQQKIDVSLARKFGNALLRKGAEEVNLKSFRFYDRMLPMQDHLPKGGFGNLIALPLQGQALKCGNSVFVDEAWNAYPEQWEILMSKCKLSKEFIEDKMKEWRLHNTIQSVSMEEIREKTDGKPWERKKNFYFEDVNGLMQITLVNSIYVDTSNLAPRIQNQIRELAAFSNPIFFKNQAIGLSNYDNARFIYMGKDVEGYIKIPRGLLDSLLDCCEKSNIRYEIDDQRCGGRNVEVRFHGELKESQIIAVETLENQCTGILQAATAFGKTVVCCNLIARKRVNTLILLQSSTLMDQWERALKEFLVIDEEPPEYKTPSGRIKVRKGVIGKLQGAHDSTTGIIDIAMAGSLCKKGEFHNRLKEYGMVILDECHHAASETIVDVLQEVRAKYVYGVTATPVRSDGLEKINYMLLGPIRYKFTSKERAKEQGIAHLVYPRFTRAIAPRFQKDDMHPNEAYAMIRDNHDRDEIMIGDVKVCIDHGRTPVVLSRYVDHAQKLYSKLQGYAVHIFLLSGANSKREHKEIIKQMSMVKANESMILVATGGLVGEGFDFPRLDTLIMATPVAAKSVVEQYAGRLNRDYEGKKEVIIYDYVDSHILMFDKMYYKRLKAYKQIGYDIYSNDICGAETGALVENAIFDGETYFHTYMQDLHSAKKELIISSPVISGKKVDDLIECMKDKQLAGLNIRIVTWKPDMYGYGDSGYWLELQERMRRSGFEMNLVEDYCQHYCMIDREIVWYGSLNFLGKEDIGDNLMRVKSESIAAELIELTFSDDKLAGEKM